MIGWFYLGSIDLFSSFSLVGLIRLDHPVDIYRLPFSELYLFYVHRYFGLCNGRDGFVF